MARCGVPAAAAIDILAPRDRVIAAHRSAGIGRFIEARQDMNGTAGIAAEIVPFVDPLPACRQALGRRVIGVLDADRRVLNLRVAGEPGADEAAVPRPVIFGVAGGMNADKAAARADVSFERSLLLLIEDVPGRAGNITTLYCASVASVKRPASSVSSTLKPCSAPSTRTAAMPSGIES